MIKIILIAKRLKTIVMIQENLEELPIVNHSKCNLNHKVKKKFQ